MKIEKMKEMDRLQFVAGLAAFGGVRLFAADLKKLLGGYNFAPWIMSSEEGASSQTYRESSFTSRSMPAASGASRTVWTGRDEAACRHVRETDERESVRGRKGT